MDFTGGDYMGIASAAISGISDIYTGDCYIVVSNPLDLIFIANPQCFPTIRGEELRERRGWCVHMFHGTMNGASIADYTATVKLDNLVHVGHNTRVGQDCLLCGQTGVSGSVEIGNNVVLGGQTGVVDNIFIGDGVISGGGTKILSNVPAGRVIMGYPGIKMESHTEIYKAQRRLPRMARDVEALKKAVFKQPSSD